MPNTGSSYEYYLTHEDGTEVTAQEVYDAYRLGNIIVNIPQGIMEEVSDLPTHYRSIGYMVWLDGDMSQNNPNNVGLVLLALYGIDTPIYVGNKELIPE